MRRRAVLTAGILTGAILFLGSGTQSRADEVKRDSGYQTGAGVEMVLGAAAESELSEADSTAGKKAAGRAIRTSVSTEEKKQDFGYQNLGIAKVDNHLNIRSTPDENGELTGKLPRDAACEILSLEDKWARIRSGKVEGYVNTDYLYRGEDAERKAAAVSTTKAVSTSGGLRVREAPNTDCDVITLIAEGEALEVVEQLDGWVKVLVDDEAAYISSDYVKIEKHLETAVSMNELKYGAGVSNVRVDLITFARQFIGNPYVWGGTSLTNGADCSGFTQSVFRQFGIKIPRTSVEQSQTGTTITLAEAKPGDLIFYAKSGRINHVALYIGNNQVVHASSPKTGIKISNATYRAVDSVKRVIAD